MHWQTGKTARPSQPASLKLKKSPTNHSAGFNADLMQDRLAKRYPDYIATSRTREASSHGRHDRFRRFHARRRRAQARRRAQGRRLPRAGMTRARPRWVPRDCFPFLVGY